MIKKNQCFLFLKNNLIFRYEPFLKFTIQLSIMYIYLIVYIYFVPYAYWLLFDIYKLIYKPNAVYHLIFKQAK